MSIQDTLTKAGPIAQSIWQDDEFQDRIRGASSAARAAVAKKRRGAPPPTVLQRAGTALSEAGRAIAAAASVGAKADPPKKRGRSLAPLLIVAGVAGYYLTQRDPNPTEEVPHG